MLGRLECYCFACSGQLGTRSYGLENTKQVPPGRNRVQSAEIESLCRNSSGDDEGQNGLDDLRKTY